MARGVVPVLTTQPHPVDPKIPLAIGAPHIDQCNEVMRLVARENAEHVIFVDTDRQVTEVHDEFFERDVGHMTAAGQRFKAEAIGAAILTHWREHAGKATTGK